MLTELAEDVAKLKGVDTEIDPLISQAFTVAAAVQAQINNPFVEQTIAIVKNVLEIGGDIPFIGPICAILKVIVDVELRAREAEKRCSALLERINFMVDHLQILKPVSYLCYWSHKSEGQIQRHKLTIGNV